jgi:hypothetical protein
MDTYTHRCALYVKHHVMTIDTTIEDLDEKRTRLVLDKDQILMPHHLLNMTSAAMVYSVKWQLFVEDNAMVVLFYE